ncbi:MAG: hypothetical protein EON51_01930 [Acinetobacter sp.]|nr:MAG: hypothetical protein EON51_01930 [Acinetobacter sp.]
MLQIILHQDCESCTTSENSFIWDFSKDFLFPLFLAGLAAYTAWFIFIRETKRDKLKEQHAETQTQLDRLQYFSNTVSSIISIVGQQKTFIDQFIEEIDKNELEFHLLTFIPIHDLRRVTKDMDIEKYLLAYVSHYPENRKLTIKEFNEIIGAIDYFYELLGSLHGQMEKAQQFDFERKKKYQDQHTNAHSLYGKIMMDKDIDKKLVTDLEAIGTNFFENFPNNYYDLQYFNDKYFEPFNGYLTDYLARTGNNNPMVLEFAAYTRDAKQTFQQIKNGNRELMADFNETSQAINSELVNLKMHSERLRAQF